MTDVTITTMLVQESDRAYAFWDGATHEVVDATTGEVTTRRHYHWVPKSQRTIKRRTIANERGKAVTIVEVELPEWLARKSGLLDGRCSKTEDLFK